jgi:uncharacterized protein YwgA
MTVVTVRNPRWMMGFGIVYVLEALGAPFRYRYKMHFNEPYSEDLERRTSTSRLA